MNVIIGEAAKFFSDPLAFAVALGFVAFLISLAAIVRGMARKRPKG